MKKTSLFIVAVITGVIVAPLIVVAYAAFYVDGSTGFVGIANTNPFAPLDVSGAMYSRMVTATSSTVDWNAGNVQQMTLTSSPTLSFSNGQAGGEYTLILAQDGTGGRSVTWPASVLWPSGVPPTLTSTANATDTVTFVYDGAHYLGSAILDYASQDYITYADSGGAWNTSTGTTSIPYTVSGSNNLLVVGVSTLNDTVSGVTYDGTSMSLIAKSSYPGVGTLGVAMYYLLNPDLGTHTISVTTSSGIVYGIMAASYSGVKQTGQPDGYSTTNDSSATTHSCSLTTASDGDWIVLVQANSGTAASGSGGSTVRLDPTGSNLGNGSLVDSGGSVGSAGSHTISWTSGVAVESRNVCAAFAPGA